jgi:signal transduction histidine kinase
MEAASDSSSTTGDAPAVRREFQGVRDEADTVFLEVEDTGAGISAADQERLFERFFRTASATEQAIPGIGLGLSISQAIAKAHAGKIVVSSLLGVGTTFRFEAPLPRANMEISSVPALAAA